MATKTQARPKAAAKTSSVASKASSSVPKGASTRSKKVAKTDAQQSVEDYATDTIEVVGADGEVRILAELEDDEFDVAQPEPTIAHRVANTKASKAVAADRAARIATKGPKQELSPAAKKALEKAEKARIKAEADVARLKAEAKQRKEAEVAKKKADAEAKKQERIEARAEAGRIKAEAREAAKAEREAARLRARGETGDPEFDATFHQAVEKATALALVPPSTNALRLSVLSIPGVTLTNLGLTLPKGLKTTDWVEIVNGFTGINTISAFGLGDALAYGEVEYGKAYDVLSESLNLSRKTVKNYKLVAANWPIEDRVEGASFYQHLYALGLYQKNPAAARNILEQAALEHHTDLWVKEQVAEAQGTAGPAAPAVRRQDELARLATLTTQQFEADLAELETPAQIEAARTADVASLVRATEENDAVASEQVQRVIARLNGQVQHWQARALAAEARLAELGEAQARVADEAAGDTLAFLRDEDAIEGEYTEGATDDVLDDVFAVDTEADEDEG